MAEQVIGSLKVTVGMDTTEFVAKSRSFGDQLKVLKGNMAELTNTMGRLDNKGAILSKQIENNRKQYELYNSKIKENAKIIADAANRMEEAKKRVSELNQKKSDGIALTAKEQKELNNLTKETDNFTKAEQKVANQTVRFQAEMAKLNREFTELTIKQKMQSDGWLSFGKGLETAGKKLNTLGNLTSKVGSAITTTSAIASAGIFGLVKVASDYESAFAGVRKTVSATEPEFKKLSAGFRELSKELPISATELAKVGENAGQLGIHVPNIVGFTEVMAKLGIATNLSSDEASTSLAKFANITQMQQENFDRLGSSIVELGNNFATTEADIVSMATNLAGAGHAVGLSEADILGVATALSSVGIEAERGGSTFSKLIVNMKVASEVGLENAVKLSEITGLSMRELELMASNNTKGFKNLADSIGMTTDEIKKVITANKNLEQFAKVAGVSAEEFRRKFGEDAVGAIALFVDGLATAEQRGTSTVEILNEMGISEVRLRDTLLRMGGAQNLFNSAVAKSNSAWKENVALNHEVAERNKTTASQFEMFKNKIIDVAISAGEKLLPTLNNMIKDSDWLIDSISGLVNGFANMDDGLKRFIIQSTLLGLALGPVINIFGNGIKLVGTFASTIGSGIVKFRELANVAKGVSESSKLLGAGIESAGIATKAFTLLTNPWVLGISAGALAIGGLVLAYNQLTKESRESAERIKRWGSDVGVELDKVLTKTKKFSDEVAVNMDITTTGDYNSISKSYTDMFSGLKETVDQNTKEFESLYSKLPEVAKKYAQEEYEHRLQKHEEIKSKIAENETAINLVLQKASNERRALRQDEKDYIAKLENESKMLAISTFKKSQEERVQIMKNLSSDLQDVDANVLRSRHVKLREVGKQITDEYKAQSQSIKEALNDGLLTQKEYTESMSSLDNQYLNAKKEWGIKYAQVVQEQLNRIDEQIEKSSEVERQELELTRDAMVKGAEKILQEYGLTWEQAIQLNKNRAEHLKQDSALLANAGNSMVEKLSENVKKANEHWNSLITDKETGRVTSNINKVISEAIKTKEGWDALRFDIKNADISTNAREQIQEVLKATGKWDELSLEEKMFVTATNSGIILAKILQDKGKWDELSPEVKHMILQTNATEEQMKYMYAFELWKDAEFVKKWAEIDTNAPDSEQKFTNLLNKWKQNDFNNKKLTFESNKDVITREIDAVASRIYNVPSRKNIMFSVGATVSDAASRIMNGLSYYSEYATGTHRHGGGLAVLGDGGRREPFLTPDGVFGVSPDSDTLFNLPMGTKVWSSINKFRNNAKYDDRLKGLISKLPHFASGTTDSFLNFNTKHDFLRGNKTDINTVTKNNESVINYTINISDVVVKEESDIEKIANKVISLVERNRRQYEKQRGVYSV
ncbi:phage tail tape measure protein [Carnobacteriaceae bacterium zg-ZUI252]|nr:phage tail tape measure protein [Carnobacteriaceae bacterium zg-ZUI252]